MSTGDDETATNESAKIMNTTQSQKQQDEQAKVNEGFGHWSSRSDTKLMISLLPPLVDDTQREAFRTLLRSAYEGGHGHGMATVAIQMLEAMVNRSDSDRRGGGR